MRDLTLRRLLPVAVLTAVLAAPAAATADISGPQLVAWMNAQRAAHGFPSDIVEDPVFSADCALHNNYGALNNILAHVEDPAKAGYTPAGSMIAGKSVLYQGSTWTADANPFEMAPIHLNQLLSPLIDRAGASENAGYGCMTTLASTQHATTASDTLLPYPSDGTRGWRASEVDREGPTTPGATVGIPQGTRTGPTLYALADGPGVAWTSPTKVQSASLTGPGGPVDIVTFDRSSPQIGDYLPAGAQILPRAPLAAGTTYTAALRLLVTTSSGARTFSRTWSFTTAGTPGETVVPGGAGAGAGAAGGDGAGSGAGAGAASDSAGGAGGADAAAGAAGCVANLRYTGLTHTAAGRRTVGIRAKVCAASTLRFSLKRGGLTVLTRSKKVTPGVRVLRVVLPRTFLTGRYTVRAKLGGMTLKVSRLLPAR